jgi:deoxyadenosine/deoxycytidine kinase
MVFITKYNSFLFLKNMSTQKWWIVLNGNIGAGKTTAAKALAREYGGFFFHEKGFEKMLKLVKDNPLHWSSVFQFHMFGFARESSVEFKRQSEHGAYNMLVLDRSIVGNWAFASVQNILRNIPDDIYEMYCSIASESMKEVFVHGAVEVYCHASVDRCLHWINLRNREAEKGMPREYLEMVERAHLAILIYNYMMFDLQPLVIDFEAPLTPKQILDIVKAHADNVRSLPDKHMPLIVAHENMSQKEMVKIAMDLPRERAAACFRAFTIEGYTENGMKVDMRQFFNNM